MSVQNLLARLEYVKQSSSDQWRCKCPCDHKTPSQMTVKELPDGRVLIHCFAGHSPTEILESIDMSLADLFEERIEDRIRPLYMARQEKRQQDTVIDKVKSCQLKLDMAQEMRDRGIKLTDADLTTERNAFIKMKHMQGI